tara:strand:- start:2469 stop:3842 length:1374 start_codon:yes stop_codon:yes gene_type:complete
MDKINNVSVHGAMSVHNDSVHGVMSFPKEYTELIKSLINTPIFQRLRHIKQTSLLELVFPTAVHNRFTHCLGASYIALRISDALRLEELEKKYVFVSALLHDIGHGPFSHTFENLLKSNDGTKVIKHEDWTSKFLEEYRDILKDQYLQIDHIQSFIKGETASFNASDEKEKKLKPNIIRDIVSSQLDCDRLDYLLRDSHFIGVTYGKVDLEWIISNLVIINNVKDGPRLGITEKGYPSVEHFLLARRMMTRNIFQHNKTRLLEKLLIFFLKEFSEEIKGKSLSSLKNKLEIFLVNAANFREGRITREKFLDLSFGYYKELTDYDVWMLIRDKALEGKNRTSNQIAKKIYERSLHKTFPFDKKYLDAVKYISKKLPYDNWQVFVLDNEFRTYTESKNLIYVKKNNGKISSLQGQSSLVANLTNKSETLHYLCIDPNLLSSDNQKKKIKECFFKYIDID